MGEEPSEASSWENWATEPSVQYVPRSIPEQIDGYYDFHFIQDGAAFAQNAYVVDIAAQGFGRDAWMNSDDYMKACLTYAIHEDENL